ncbi:MAG: type VI secretion system baseplate subunit TssK [Pseudomonadota bacterium]
MSFENKVIWNEGLFLQPHHLQQHDRYIEALVGGVATGIAPAPWGVRELAIDQSLLKLGKFAVTRCVGLTPDGALFRAPEADAHPPALEVPENVRDRVVYLAIPARRPGAMEVDLTGDPQTVARFVPHEIGVTDCQGQDPRTERLAVAKMHLRLALDLDDLSDQLVIPIARIIEVRADKQVVLDAAFIPSCTDSRAATPISEFLRELEGLLSHRADALAARLGQEGAAKGVADISDFLLLIAINRALPQIRHLQAISNAHPAVIYQLLTALAGELATFMAANKRAGEFPLYRHDDLSNTFQPVFRILREYLSTVIEQNAIAIPIEARKYGVSVAMIADKRLLTSARFVLAVKADVAIESIRRHFPSQAKLGPVEEIRQLVNSALPGIGLRPLPVAPRQIPYHAESVYFDVDPDSAYWRQMTTSGGMAVHISGDFPGLTMDLWAIRKS